MTVTTSPRVPHYAGELVTLFHGDCLEVLRELPDESVDAVVTDPPYGIGFMGHAWDQPGEFGAVRSNGKPGPHRRRANVDHTTTSTRDGAMEAGLYDLSLTANRRFQAWCEAWAYECLRILKPGGHLLSFCGTRTWHRMAAGIEDAGFEVRDSIAWLYGSGFPKSLDVSKAIDKRRDDRELILSVTAWVREARDAAGITNRQIDEALGTNGMAGHFTSAASQPHIPTAELWPKLLDLLGIDEPPAHVREAVDEWLRIKGQPGPTWQLREVTGQHDKAAPGQSWNARHGLPGDLTPKERRDKPATSEAERWQGWGTALKPSFEPVIVARKPLAGTVAANVLAHGTGALNINACRTSAGQDDRDKCASVVGLASNRNGDAYGEWAGVREDSAHDAGRWPANVVLDESQAAELNRHSGKADAAEGGAARFFPTFRYEAKAPTVERPRAGDTAHPTVKPVDLMRWLVRLVTPPGGTVLEPFAGSGTTAEACVVEGFRCIAVEREASYLPLIVQRLTRGIQTDLLAEATA